MYVMRRMTLLLGLLIWLGAPSVSTASIQFVKLWRGSAEFSHVYGIAIGSSGDAYVADGGADRVQVFDSDGAFLNVFGGASTTEGQFQTPQGDATDSSGN